jgi:hypothetical protein
MRKLPGKPELTASITVLILYNIVLMLMLRYNSGLIHPALTALHFLAWRSSLLQPCGIACRCGVGGKSNDGVESDLHHDFQGVVVTFRLRAVSSRSYTKGQLQL